MKTIHSALDAIRSRLGATPPDIAVILGSGLGPFVDALESKAMVPYGEIPNFPRPSVAGHAGECAIGTLGDRRVLAFCGRFHAYEGHPLDIVTLPLRVLGSWGVRRLVVTNASGGIRSDLGPGSLMAITDHLNLTGKNPLVGPNLEALGERFSDMSRAYDPAFLAHAREVAQRLGITLHEGVYAGVSGPCYETPAEIRAYRTLGADAVGMSTVPEVIVANHQRMRVFGLSMITNHAAGTAPGGSTITHAEVLEQSDKTRARFVQLLTEWVKTVAL